MHCPLQQTLGDQFGNHRENIRSDCGGNHIRFCNCLDHSIRIYGTIDSGNVIYYKSLLIFICQHHGILLFFVHFPDNGVIHIDEGGVIASLVQQ